MSCPVANISVLQRVGANPGFRDSASVLFTDIPEGICEVVLNFQGVTFISRGFADELHQLRQSLQAEQTIPLTIENANEEILAMLEAVSRTQGSRINDTMIHRIFRVDGTSDLEDLLLGS